MDVPVTITIEIGQSTPVLDAATENYLKVARREGAKVSQRIGRRLSLQDEVWLTTDVVHRYADEMHFSRNGATRALNRLIRFGREIRAAKPEDRWRLPPPEFAKLRLLAQPGHPEAVNATDFVELLDSEEMREQVSMVFGVTSSAFLIALADHLKQRLTDS